MYYEAADPLVQGVDISEESGEGSSVPSLESVDSSSDDMEGVEGEKRGKKRQHEAWDDRQWFKLGIGRTWKVGKEGRATQAWHVRERCKRENGKGAIG